MSPAYGLSKITSLTQITSLVLLLVLLAHMRLCSNLDLAHIQPFQSPNCCKLSRLSLNLGVCRGCAGRVWRSWLEAIRKERLAFDWDGNDQLLCLSPRNTCSQKMQNVCLGSLSTQFHNQHMYLQADVYAKKSCIWCPTDRLESSCPPKLSDWHLLVLALQNIRLMVCDC